MPVKDNNDSSRFTTESVTRRVGRGAIDCSPTRALTVPPLIKIAIIGSGIAGLSAAYRLSRGNVGKVTLFERHSRPGIDAHRVDIGRDGHQVAVDVPSRMFNTLQWPSLSRLYHEIGVLSLPVESSQSFSVLDASSPAEQKSNVGLKTYLHRRAATRTIFPIRELVWSSNRRIAKESARFLHAGTEYLKHFDGDESEPETLRDFLKRRSFQDEFVYCFLYPTLASTVCTCRYESLNHYPAHVVLQTLANLTRSEELRRTRFGTSDVANRLCRHDIEIVNDVTVDVVVDAGPTVRLNMSDGQARLFDHVIIATQANTALSLLSDACRHEREILQSIGYDDVPVVVHTDTQLMPKRRSKWSTFNMLIEPTFASASCTVWLNRFYGNWKFSDPVFQTIGLQASIDESKIIRRAVLHRSVVDQRSIAALDRLGRIHHQQERRIWFCGSWAGRGLPLLESAVVSAEQVADRLAKIATRQATVEHR